MNTEINIEPGWMFYSADFSMNVAVGIPGTVMLIRDRDEVERWHLMDDDSKRADSGPPLYVCGSGINFSDAFDDANQKARDAIPIPQAEHPLSGLHINHGSMDAAADAYQAEYDAAHNRESLK